MVMMNFFRHFCLKLRFKSTKTKQIWTFFGYFSLCECAYFTLDQQWVVVKIHQWILNFFFKLPHHRFTSSPTVYVHCTCLNEFDSQIGHFFLLFACRIQNKFRTMLHRFFFFRPNARSVTRFKWIIACDAITWLTSTSFILFRKMCKDAMFNEFAIKIKWYLFSFNFFFLFFYFFLYEDDFIKTMSETWNISLQMSNKITRFFLVKTLNELIFVERWNKFLENVFLHFNSWLCYWRY